MVNIRVSDSMNWFDCNVGHKMRIYFVGGMQIWGDIKVYELIVIEGTSGTLGNKDFVLESFKRPGNINISNPNKIGIPLPLYSAGICTDRGVSSINTSDLLPETPTRHSEQYNFVTDSDEEMLASLCEDDHTAELGDTVTLDELLSTCYTAQPSSLHDTPLLDRQVTEQEVLKSTISKLVFENARHLFKHRKYDIAEKPKLVETKATYTVDSEFSAKSYDVIIEWPEMMPRLQKPFTKTFKFSCSCGAFEDYGPKYCKHIVFIIMKHLNYV